MAQLNFALSVDEGKLVEDLFGPKGVAEVQNKTEPTFQDKKTVKDDYYVMLQQLAAHMDKILDRKYTVPLYGYAAPFVIAFTIIINSLCVAVLLKKHMRSSTNILLAFMALSDMLTGILPLPIFIYFFSLGYCEDFIPFGWCLPFNVLYGITPTILHTASVWQTMALAVQRYIYVCHPVKARRWCTVHNALRAVISTYVMAFLIHAARFVDFKAISVNVQSLTNPNTTFKGCVFVSRIGQYLNDDYLYNVIYLCSRIIFIQIVPCISLLVITVLLIKAMKKAGKRRTMLLKQNKVSESQEQMKTSRTTLMLVIILGLFLITEFPGVIIMTMSIIDHLSGLFELSKTVYGKMVVTWNFGILVMYPLNFFIYCGMSHRFRKTVKELFTRRH